MTEVDPAAKCVAVGPGGCRNHAKRARERLFGIGFLSIFKAWASPNVPGSLRNRAAAANLLTLRLAAGGRHDFHVTHRSRVARESASKSNFKHAWHL